MADQLPEPLVPPDVDLTDFQFVPLYIERLRKSKAWLICKRRPELAFYLMNLWMRAWHETPAGSIEADDDVLSDASMCDVRRFSRIKGDLLRGWLQCSDKRLYHPVIAELAKAAWADKLSHRARTRAATEAKEAKRRAEKEAEAAQRNDQRGKRDVQRNDARDDARDVHQGRGKGEVRESKGKGRSKGEGKETPNPNPSAPGSSPRTPRKPPNGEAPTAATWEAYAAAYEHRHHAKPVRNRTVNGQLANFVTRIPAAEAPAVAAFYVQSNRGLYVSAKHPVNLLLRDAEALRTEWFTGRSGTHTEAMQADRTQANGNSFQKLIAEADERERSAAK